MTADLIAVTGASGRLGGRVARRLAGRGGPLRLVVRDAAKAPKLAGSEVAIATYEDRAALERAFTGAKTLFFVSGAESTMRTRGHYNVIDAAMAAGVEHVVYTSFIGAAWDATFTLARDHGVTEKRLLEKGVAATFLRDNLYADFLPMMVGKDDVLRGPAGQGRVAAVAQDDIAEAAAAVLLEPAAHRGKVYELTGPEAITLAEAARVMSQHLGREIRFHDETLEEAYASRAGYQAPKWQLDAWVSTYTAIKEGALERVSDDVRKLTGHAARSLAQVL